MGRQTEVVPTDVQVAYAAGIIDGEGSLYVNPSGSAGGQIIVAVTNTDLRLLEWLYRVFGGRVQGQRITRPRNKPWWSWVIQSQNAERFLQRVRPYLILKAEKADLALAHFALRGQPHVRLSPAAAQARREIHAQLRILNRRGAENA